MLGQHLKSQISEEWQGQRDEDWSFITGAVVCRELGNILKEEGFDFRFNPNEFLQLNDESYDYDIEITIGDIDGLFYCEYE